MTKEDGKGQRTQNGDKMQYLRSFILFWYNNRMK